MTTEHSTRTSRRRSECESNVNSMGRGREMDDNVIHDGEKCISADRISMQK